MTEAKPAVGSTPIYLDHHATTPVDPRVLEAMLPYFTERFGNAASRTHRRGWDAKEAVERAREQVARALGAAKGEIVFTSGATEANNLALAGLLDAYGERRRGLVVSAIEHPSVLDTARWLAEARGAKLTILPVEADGVVRMEAVREAVDEHTLLCSVMAANNEVGTLQPIAEIGAHCRSVGAFFHTDAVQAIGKVPFDVLEQHVDCASLSGHKVHGPQGIGAIFLKRRDPRVRPAPLLHGGGHERGFRSGTLPLPLIVGLGEALALAAAERERESRVLLTLRDRLHRLITDALEGVVVHGTMEEGARLPGNLNLSFEGVEAEPLLLGLRELCLSSGSACASATPTPSHVLRAMGVSDDLAHGSLRFGIGRYNTEVEIDRAAELVIARVRKLRGS
ncbi:MAG: cysteine desulfurase family protein [Deltaproteobacteria bacterium]|nr:cysteine desulfurase family protein [Deltaproteobacteria bacterium]